MSFILRYCRYFHNNWYQSLAQESVKIMAGVDVKASGIEKFDGTDFGYWKMQIEDYLYGKKLHLPLLGTKPDTITATDWDLLDRQVLGVIRLTLSRSVAHNVIKEKTTAELMTALSGMYEKPSANNKVHLMKKLFNLRMSNDTSVAQHLNDYNTITNQLSSVEIEFDDEIRALILLASLPNDWEAMRMAVSNSAGKSKLNYDDIRDLILAEEVRRRDSGEISGLSSALNIESRGRAQYRYSNRGRSKSRGKSKPRLGHQATCWNCGKIGHIKRNCKNPRKAEIDSAHVVAEEVQDALLLAVHSSIEDWVLDSGASFHTSSHRESMQNYVAGDFGKVYLADGEALNVVGMGDVNVALPNKSKWILQNVRHIPELKKNLISVGQLDDSGFSVVFSNGTWKVIKGALVLAKGKKTGTLYTTTGPNNTIAAIVAESTADLWHCRLGHMSPRGMKELLSRGKLSELKTVDLSICESCIMGKQKKVSFLKGGRTLKTRKLDLVHTDVWGPSPAASLGGSRYYVTFIDDHSRKVWIYFLKHKSDVFHVFKTWKAMVETETDLKLKCLRSDNGGEYIDGGLKEFCASQGIRMEKTIPGTPQQNGVAERMNRTINERARSMRLHAGLPLTFWADAVSTAVYLINRGPSIPLDNELPEEVWSGKEVKFSHLKTFGCLAYVLIEPNARNKLESKSRKCYFIGYGDEAFGYRFWDDKERKIIRSRNVIFNEKVMFKDKINPSEVETHQESDFVQLDDLSEVMIPERNESGSSTSILNPESYESDEESGSSTSTSIIPLTNLELNTPTAAIRRTTRITRPPKRFSPILNYILLTDGGEPQNYQETLQDEHSSKWELAMKEEMNSLLGNQTWELTKLPPGKKALHNKWVYRIKSEHDGSKRYKARLVVKGFQQQQGIDYSEIFSPVVKITTIRLVLAMVATENLFLEQLDVKTAFLHGNLDEDIYMYQPEGFVAQGHENSVCRLKKSLYGLKQAPRQWYKKFDSFMLSAGYMRCQADHCCYVKKFENSYVILLLYVDDMLIAGANIVEINKLKKLMSEHFEMKDLGAAKQILGMRIARDRIKGTLTLSQAEYIRRILSRFSMDNAKPVGTPLGNHFKLSKNQSPKSEEERHYMNKVPYASAVGSLMYAMICTRPDISHAVGVVSRYMSNPGKQHWEAVKWILRYLKGSTETCLCFSGEDLVVQGYVDADLAGDIDSRKSTTGFVYTYGGTAVSWGSNLQKTVSLSTTEAEYIAVSEAAKEMIWLQNFLEELGKERQSGTLHSDSQSAIFLAKNPAYHSRTKHISIRYHFIRSLLDDRQLLLEKICGSKNPADMLTKGVTLEKLKLCSTSVGLSA